MVGEPGGGGKSPGVESRAGRAYAGRRFRAPGLRGVLLSQRTDAAHRVVPGVSTLRQQDSVTGHDTGIITVHPARIPPGGAAVPYPLAAALTAYPAADHAPLPRSEERRVGKECRSRLSADQ